MTDPCPATGPLVTVFIIVILSFCTLSCGWLLITVIWDDIRARAERRRDGGRGYDLVI